MDHRERAERFFASWCFEGNPGDLTDRTHDALTCEFAAVEREAVEKMAAMNAELVRQMRVTFPAPLKEVIVNATYPARHAVAGVASAQTRAREER